MATVPFPGDWIPDVQFSGNSGFVFDTAGVIWLVANSTTSGVLLFKSSDHGATFQQAASIPNVGSAGLSFDPAIAIDANNVLHIVGQVAGGSPFLINLVKYSYDTMGEVLTGPFSLTVDGIVGSDYDIVALANGHTYVVTSLLTGMTETVEGMEIDATGTVLSTDVYFSQLFGAGNRFGSVSLYSPDGVSVDVYFCSIPKVFVYLDSTAVLSVVTRSSTRTLSAPTELTSFPARYVADRLTVIPQGQALYLVQGYFSQKKATLIGNVVLGYRANPTAEWVFQSFSGTALGSLVEPVLSVSSTGAVLAVIQANLAQFTNGASISLYDFDPVAFSLVPRTDFPYPGLANWLRGTKGLIPDAMVWGIVSQRSIDGVGRFYTGFSVPPVAELVPASSTNERGVTYTFDASASFDLNMHPLQFSWALNDPTGLAALVPNGSTATVMLPLSAGPAAQTLTLTVSVVDTDINGTPLHAASTASAVINYPLIPAPVIGTPAPIEAARNSQVTLNPLVTVSIYTTPTYFWTQTGGTPVTILSQPTAKDLTLATNGAAVAGETLTFTLIVNDGINTPVSQAFEVIVAARVPTGETTHIARSLRPGSIAQRNTTAVWPAPTASAVLSGFTRAKRAPVVVEHTGVPGFVQSGSYLLIGPKSIVVERNGETWHVLTPDPSDTILDAVHSFLDQTIVLTASQQLQQFIPLAPAVDTDNATRIQLSQVSSANYTTIEATPPFAGQRVVVLTSSAGVLLLAINSSFQVAGSLELTGTSGLYGAADVQWVRLSDVESLHTGILLIGTIDADGNTYETEYSLATRSVIAVYDSASRKKSQHVTTGEILFESVDSYSGVPLAPVLAAPSQTSGGVTLSWSQTRPDLVSGYQIQATAGGVSSPLRTISSGMIFSIVIQPAEFPSGVTNQVSMVALSADGDSAASNAVNVNL